MDFLLQTRALLGQVKSAQLIESWLRRSCGARNTRSTKSHSLAPGQMRFESPCNPMLRLCNKRLSPVSAQTSHSLSKTLWGRSAHLTCVLGTSLQTLYPLTVWKVPVFEKVGTPCSKSTGKVTKNPQQNLRSLSQYKIITTNAVQNDNPEKKV